MYSGTGFSSREIGDGDVFIDENWLHHLLISNHDWIAKKVI